MFGIRGSLVPMIRFQVKALCGLIFFNNLNSPPAWPWFCIMAGHRWDNSFPGEGSVNFWLSSNYRYVENRPCLPKESSLLPVMKDQKLFWFYMYFKSEFTKSSTYYLIESQFLSCLFVFAFLWDLNFLSLCSTTCLVGNPRVCMFGGGHFGWNNLYKSTYNGSLEALPRILYCILVLNLEGLTVHFFFFF